MVQVLLALAFSIELGEAAGSVLETCQEKCQELCGLDTSCAASCQESTCQVGSWSELFFWLACCCFLAVIWVKCSTGKARIRKIRLTSDEIHTKYSRL